LFVLPGFRSEASALS